MPLAHCDIFREQLAIKFPAYGHALWHPSPGSLYDAMQVGDVGHTREGRFQRLFNILLPANDPSHQNYGVPEYHEPFQPSVPNHIDSGILRPNDFCSAGVALESGDGSPVFAAGPESSNEISFSCKRKPGAVLSLPMPATREDTVLQGDFGKWITKNIDRWFAWTRRLGLGIDRMEDIILVTGIHRTRSWINVAFSEGEATARASFGVEVGDSGDSVIINRQPSRERNRGAILNWGPNGEHLPENQCIFIRGFRVTRKLMILPRLRGAAGPNPDPNGYDSDCEPDTELVSIPAVPSYRDPLHTILQYIVEAAPNCDMALVHDDDLAFLDRLGYNTTREALQPDVELSYLRSSKPLIHEVLCGSEDLLADSNNTVADRGIVRVATLSAIYERLPERRISDPMRERMISPNQAYVVSSRTSETPHPQVHHSLSWLSSTPQPRPQYDVSRGHQSHRDQLHALDTQSSSSCVGKRKALLIGVNYPVRPNCSINRDVFEIAYFLHGFGFERNSMQVLTDDQPSNLPTKNNILAAMNWLVKGAQSGDSLFFYFSGPAAQINGGGPDGPNEAMCAMDYMGDVQSQLSPNNPWTITDNDVHDILIKPLPSNCRLTAVLDTCHSGTLLDLPFIYDPRGSLKLNKPGVVERRSTGADVISLSSCNDHHLGFHDGRASEAFHGGAMRRISQSFKECMTSSGYRMTYFDVIRSLCAGVHANGFRQQPQLSSSRPIAIDQRFII